MGKYKKQTNGVQHFENWSPDTKEKSATNKATEKGDETLEKMSGNHFATRERANDFVRLMRSLPDPDPILRKMGRGIMVLRCRRGRERQKRTRSCRPLYRRITAA